MEDLQCTFDVTQEGLVINDTLFEGGITTTKAVQISIESSASSILLSIVLLLQKKLVHREVHGRWFLCILI